MNEPRLIKRELHYAILTARSGEEFYYHEEKPEQDCYAVMLHQAPAFPGQSHEECTQFSVLCCGKYITLETSPSESKWGWIELNADTRNLIGSDLLEMNAEPGRWYYLTVSGGFALQKIGIKEAEIFSRHLVEALKNGGRL
jgi:hypothetical protein